MLIDHRQPMLDALRLYLNRFSDEWAIVAEADRVDEKTLLATLRTCKPDVLIVNRMTDGAMLRPLLKTVKAEWPDLGVVVTGVSNDEASDLTQWGVDDLVYSMDPPSTLLTRLRALRYDREERSR